MASPSEHHAVVNRVEARDPAHSPGGPPNRSAFDVMDSIRYIWQGLQLPDHALDAVQLDEDGLVVPSSFKIGHIALASIALSALAASLVDSLKNSQLQLQRVSVPLRHAVLEFAAERMYVLDGQPAGSGWGPIGGLYKTTDGHVRIHDSFAHHDLAAMDILACKPAVAAKADVAAATRLWCALDLEAEATKKKAVIYALRSYKEWDYLPQARAVSNFPITIRKIDGLGPLGFSSHMPAGADRCLRGLRVLEFSRVIAAPVAGKTLAAHGADVLWVTSPNLPSQPVLDCEFARGKRTIQLDLENDADRENLRRLAAGCDVFIQSYRPGSFAAKGLGAADLARLRPGIVYASLSAWGHEGPWSRNRGFDSIVQNVSGMNVSEAEHFGDGSPSRPLPCQALDHAAGFLLAAGIAMAVYKRASEGGSWEVQVSLAAVMKYLRSLGQYPGDEGFACTNVLNMASEEADEFRETRSTGLGMLHAVRHAATVENRLPGWDHMPKPLGSDEPKWL